MESRSWTPGETSALPKLPIGFEELGTDGPDTTQDESVVEKTKRYNERVAGLERVREKARETGDQQPEDILEKALEELLELAKEIARKSKRIEERDNYSESGMEAGQLRQAAEAVVQLLDTRVNQDLLVSYFRGETDRFIDQT